MANSVTQRDERIDLRLPAETKTLLTRAASYSGMSLSGYLVSTAAGKARELVAKHESLILSPHDWQAFLSTLDNVDKPRPKLEAAARRYSKRRESDSAN
ncbi:MAG TPA: DUF1778 domain-containing protein [Gammaproteobacteria bacterium]|nr:DUF1778 domain-containing protein [Gammaproteobacteria bacterium]